MQRNRGARVGATIFVVATLGGALGLYAAPAIADSGPALNGSTAFNSERKIAGSPDGTLFATYVDSLNNTSTVLVRKSSDGGATWSLLPPLSTAEAFRSSIAIDGKGRVHVAWSEMVEGVRQVFYGRWEGGPGWLGVGQVSHTPGYSGFPALGVDSKDRVHLVWYGFDGANYQIFYSWLPSDGGWAPVVQATQTSKDANNPAIAVGLGDRVHVAFYTYFRGETDVWYMAADAGVWSTPERVNAQGQSAERPSLVVFPDGAAAVAWASTSTNASEIRFSQRGASGNWSQELRVSEANEGADNPSLTASPEGDVVVFYETLSGAIRSASRIGGTWSVPVTLKAGPGHRWPSVSWAAYPQNPSPTSVLVVWTSETPQGTELRFARIEVFPPAQCLCGPDMEATYRIAIIGGVGAVTAGAVAALLWKRRSNG